MRKGQKSIHGDQTIFDYLMTNGQGLSMTPSAIISTSDRLVAPTSRQRRIHTEKATERILLCLSQQANDWRGESPEPESGCLPLLGNEVVAKDARATIM